VRQEAQKAADEVAQARKKHWDRTCSMIFSFGYGSIPINTIFSGMTRCSPGVQGFDTLPFLPMKNWDSIWILSYLPTVQFMKK